MGSFCRGEDHCRGLQPESHHNKRTLWKRQHGPFLKMCWGANSERRRSSHFFSPLLLSTRASGKMAFSRRRCATWGALGMSGPRWFLASLSLIIRDPCCAPVTARLFHRMPKRARLIPDTHPKWIMLDGDLDANWIESMNSAAALASGKFTEHDASTRTRRREQC